MSEQDEIDDGQAAAATQDNPSEETHTSPEFQELDSQSNKNPGRFELNRFGGVQVVLTANLGQVNISLQELMDLSEGSVVELDREISEPVELVAQGVPLGNGEVVVVEDRFAIRIIQIYQNA